jgi:sugar-specific transcriptional regulator TrmB
MSSSFIAVQSFASLIIFSMVNEKINGTKESKERFLDVLLRTKFEFTRLKDEDNDRSDVENLDIKSTERYINDAIDYIKEALEEA